MGGGTVVPQNLSLPPAAQMQPETEPLWLGFDFFGPQRPLSPRAYKCNAPPPPPPHPHHHTTSPHCSPPPFPTAPPKSSSSASISDFWPPTPFSPLVFANAMSHHHHHPIHTTALPHPTNINTHF